MTRITILCDNATYIDHYCLAEPAFSCLIQDGESSILFDTGYSDVFLSNAKRLQIDLSKVSDIILSHGHNDHTGGLRYFLQQFSQPVRLYAHPKVFQKRCDHGLMIGSPLSAEDLPKTVSLHLSDLPQQVSTQVQLLGQIPRFYAFEQNRQVGTVQKEEQAIPDIVLDDTAAVIETANGIFIVTGCSHSGICNIVKRAMELHPRKPICGILGGFHLFNVDSCTQAAIQTLQQDKVQQLYPCHCTSLTVKAAMMQKLPVHETAVSLQIDLPDCRQSS